MTVGGWNTEPTIDLTGTGSAAVVEEPMALDEPSGGSSTDTQGRGRERVFAAGLTERAARWS